MRKKAEKSIFAYLKDGCYSIGNTIAEHFIRPLVDERKKTCFFGCNHMVNVSVTYLTLTSTIRAMVFLGMAYLKKFFQEEVKDLKRLENLLLMISGINTNKL